MIKNRQSLPLGYVHQGTDCLETDKPSPGTSLKVTRRQTTLSEEYACQKASLPLAPPLGTRVCVHVCMTENRQASPWHP